MTRYAVNSRIVFDLGMHNGDDTAYYLSRGFDVVALDANPKLCEQAQTRFQTAIDEGRLRIFNAAIWDKNGETTFFVNLDNDHWSSLDINWATRDGSRYKEISIRCVTFSSMVDDFGAPIT